MLKVEFTINYQCTGDNGRVVFCTSFKTIDRDLETNFPTNAKKQFISEVSDEHKDDPLFKVCGVYTRPTGEIDWDLMEYMQAVREMCELGRKVRANTGIRNRQPLGHAYVAFADPSIQKYMIYIDSGNRHYAKTLESELNVLNLEFIDDALTSKIFNYDIKPNFKVLGPKGYGKQAQALKATLQAMGIEEKNTLHTRLKNGEEISTHDIPLSYRDIEVEFSPKENLTSSTGKVGAIVLDSTMNKTLLELGFVAEFRSAVQSLRREANLELTDEIVLEVFSDLERSDSLKKYSKRLLHDLVASNMSFYPTYKAETKLIHQLFFHRENLKTDRQVSESYVQDKLDKNELSEELFYIGMYLKSDQPANSSPPVTAEEKKKITSWKDAIEAMSSEEENFV